MGGCMITCRLGVMVVLIAALYCLSCDKKGTTPAQIQSNPSIHWVSTVVIYDSTAVKKNYSILFFEADWCGWCTKLRNETLRDTQVVRILNDSFNCSTIDIESDTPLRYFVSTVTCHQLAGIYGVSGIPDMRFLDRKGLTIGRAGGYRSP